MDAPGEYDMADWGRVRKIILGGRSFIVASHTYPDGDSVGSVVAFVHLLRLMGKRAFAINPSPTPRAFRFLDRRNRLRCYRRADDGLIAQADALFILDSSTNDRLGPLHAISERMGLTRVCIDHHPGNTVDADIKVVDTGACSTSQLVYELYRACGVRIPREAAEALYAGIHTDTVSFNFLGTDARTHEIAADLLRSGLDPKEMWLKIYGNDSPRLLRLAGVTLSGLRTASSGRVVWMMVREREMKRLRVRPPETESFTRYPLTVKGAGTIAVFCEESRDRIRVSMRALDSTDVGAIARSFGGGGHRTSAGAIVRAPLARVVRDVLREMKRRGARNASSGIRRSRA